MLGVSSASGPSSAVAPIANAATASMAGEEDKAYSAMSSAAGTTPPQVRLEQCNGCLGDSGAEAGRETEKPSP